MIVADVPVSQMPYKRVILHEPESGWSAALYEQELETYAAEFGRAPRTVTMHPDTAAALGLHDDFSDAAGSSDAPFLVTSDDYERHEITLYS